MIPKVIHYCWFGHGPIPKLYQACIATWREKMPDYEIKLWNEDNFDVNIILYTAQAYALHKYAFVSDYARFWILYHYGGIYLDADVELLKSLDPIIEKGPYMGCLNVVSKPGDKLLVSSGLGIACEAGNPIVGDLMKIYGQKTFEFQSSGVQETEVTIGTQYLRQHGLANINSIQTVEGINIYPAEYFGARLTAMLNVPFTENSYSIHHFEGSWLSPWHKLKRRIANLVGPQITKGIVRIKRLLKIGHNAHIV